jgi:hypothetical protein
MQDTEKLIKNLLGTIDDAIAHFDEGIPDTQKQIYTRLETLLKSLDTTPDGRLKNTLTNLKAIGRMKGEIENIVFSPKYESQAGQFLKAFDVVSTLNKEYFSDLLADSGPEGLLDELKKQAVDLTADQLTEAGINASVTEPVRRMLSTAITTGGSFSDLLENLRNELLTNSTGMGSLQRYTRQITTDSIHQFNGQYNQALSAGLNYNWYMYLGSHLTTTRPFCDHLQQKKYFHQNELPDILNGEIDGFSVPFNPKTDIWYGGIPGTNEDNFTIYRGGYNCGHGVYKVLESVVPKIIRVEAYSRLGIAFDAETGLVA